jgi:hypothetical protein
MSQIIRWGYIRTDVQRQPVWQHCCLNDGCFNETTQ